MESSRSDREVPHDLQSGCSFESALREALLLQEEAIAGFIRAAAQHLERVALESTCPSPNASSHASEAGRGTTAAQRAASALADAARMAEALAELQRLSLQLASAMGADRAEAKPAPDPGATGGVRRSPPDKAAPAWFAAARDQGAMR